MRRFTLSRRLAAALVVGALLLGLLYVFLPGDARDLFRRARGLYESDPVAAESLLFRSIEAAGGDYPEAQIFLCQQLAMQGRWLEARGGFSLIRDAGRCRPQDLLALSQDALEAHELVLPQLALPHVVQPEYRAAALRLWIRLKLERQQLREAANDAEQLTRLDRDDPFPWRVLAEYHQRRKEVVPSIQAYREALKRNRSESQELELRSQLVELLIQLEDSAAARDELNTLTERLGNGQSLRLKNARLLRLERQTEAALREVQEVLAEQPNSVPALMLRGVLRFDLDQFDEAARDLERVVAAQPTAKEAHYKLALAYRRLARPAEAQKHLELSAKLDQASREILVIEARVEQEPGNIDLMRQLAELNQQVGRPDMAQQWQRLADLTSQK